VASHDAALSTASGRLSTSLAIAIASAAVSHGTPRVRCLTLSSGEKTSTSSEFATRDQDWIREVIRMCPVPVLGGSGR
jgi:hypothetical protein